ncbi:MAG: TesB-like acyl-CoA thioesterase 3 [Nocardioides sp.]|nr:TesB-like acyl-CoA thioesterase 3 [Nocardioides sp.]
MTTTPTPSTFDRHTAVSAAGEGQYAAELDEGWVVGGAVNGGYLLAVVGRALAEATGRPDPISLSAYYLSASRPGPATVTVRILRSGSTVTAAADVHQDDGEGPVHRIAVLATYGDLDRDADDVRTTAVEPELPPLDTCVPNDLAPPEHRPPLTYRFELRLHPDRIGFALGAPDHSGELSGWWRLEDDHQPDPIALLLAVDALPPVTFTFGHLGWAPTVELTVHVRAKPAPGWLKIRHATRNVAGGMFEEDCEVWDSAGRLVAQSRQLARYPR